MALTAELDRSPARVRLCGFVSTRTEMELVNTVAGLLTGMALLAPGDLLVGSRALSGLLLIMPEVAWGAALFLCGCASILAWACTVHRCRLATMFVWVFGWWFLAAQAGLMTNGHSIFFGAAIALGAGSFLSACRILTRGRMPHG